MRKSQQNSTLTRASDWSIGLFAITLLLISQVVMATSQEQQQDAPQGSKQQQVSTNDRMEPQIAGGEEAATASSRQGRQYDSSISSSGSGNYAAISSDSGAYVGPAPLSSGANHRLAHAGGSLGDYASNAAASYLHQDPMNRGYGSASMMYPGSGLSAGYPYPAAMSPPPLGIGASLFSGGGGGGSGGGLLPSGSPMYPLMAKGFDISDIICGSIAVAIGAVIVGAPFILLYLFIMNHMGGNNLGAGASQAGGTISLTGPSQSQSSNGRKKRQTSLSEALFSELSPLINNEQLTNTFKTLMNSIAKYQ